MTTMSAALSISPAPDGHFAHANVFCPGELRRREFVIFAHVEQRKVLVRIVHALEIGDGNFCGQTHFWVPIRSCIGLDALA